jgi:hypothetical protein
VPELKDKPTKLLIIFESDYSRNEANFTSLFSESLISFGSLIVSHSLFALLMGLFNLPIPMRFAFGIVVSQ